ncbi:MAG: DUF4157 domain-containing protein [Clostridiales bacterium]|nr:DUF4157 domain-containing protein [Clostridiales bacterium]
MYKTAEKQKIQTGTKAAPAQRTTGAPTIAIPNSAMASMAGSGGSGYATPNLDQMMQARMGGLHEDMAAEKEAVDVGRQFMNSTDVVGDMSRAYEQDLSGVRLHTDPGAAQKAEERGVDAFSTGRDIYFAQGAYDRSDPASRGPLAHELSHSLQQGVGGDASVMAQSAPVGAEQGGWRDWFRKKPKQPAEMEISEPQLKEQSTWGQEIFDKVMNQRDADLAAPGADQAAVQAQFMRQMNLLSNATNGGKVKTIINDKDKHYNDLQGAALHQLVLGSSGEELRKNTDLQNRIINSFNTRIGSEFEGLRDSTETPEGIQGKVLRGNGIGEGLAFSDMVSRMLPSDFASTLYDVHVNAEPDFDSSITASELIKRGPSAGTKATLNTLTDTVENDPLLMNVLSATRPGVEKAHFLNTDEEISAAIMNNIALRAFVPQMYNLEGKETGKVSRSAVVQGEINKGDSETKKNYSNVLARLWQRQRRAGQK